MHIDQAANQEFVHELRQAVPEVHFDRMTRLLYSTDASIYQMMPVGVALPKNLEQVTAAVEIARKHAVPILPRGNGSSLAGQAVGHALILDISRYMDQILEIDPDGRKVRTQPGITLGKLNKALAKHNLMYGPDPASADRATMGGVLGNNSTGAHSILYGMTVDHVLETQVVLSDGHTVRFDSFSPDEWGVRAQRSGLEGAIYRILPAVLETYAGEIATRYPKTFRHVAGYNLNQLAGSSAPNLANLIVGSEGSLGVITEATLNLVPTHNARRLALVHFSDFRASLEAVPRILESSPAAIEILDKMLLDLTRDRIEYSRLLTFIEGDPQSVLMVEFAGSSESEVDNGVQKLKQILDQIAHKDPLVVVTDPRHQDTVWYVRKVGLGILMSIRGDAKPIPFIEDAAVPVEHLADYITRIYDFSYEVGVEKVAIYAHASAGCMHVRPLVNLKNALGLQQLRSIAEKSVELVLEYGGTTSGEHGEGLARGEFSANLFGQKLSSAFQEVKDLFDPKDLMNPGKVVNAPAMDDEANLRFGTAYSLPNAPQPTVFNFDLDGGIGGAVEMCNGAGVCRRLDEGVMCPSFQVTREEAHSTRGRANALRVAMMGLLGRDGMTSDDLYEVLDLCLSCKACAAECPSAVDMARLKSEFLHGYYHEHGIPIRSRVFANIATLNALGQPFSPLTNILLKGLGSLIQNWLKITPERTLPSLAPQTFTRWYRRRLPAPADEGPQPVVFFTDTFTEHNHPQIGVAAIKVLEAAGYTPLVLEKVGCCGRPAVSTGVLERAVRLARHNIDLLAPYARKGIPIIGCEPSCMTMFVDEYPRLVPGEDAEAVAAMATPLDNFISNIAGSGNLEFAPGRGQSRILYHGHCQQKATFGTESTLDMLRAIPDCEVEQIQAGCCGMAGSFGYEREHYDLSIKIAEMALAGAVRSAPVDTVICTSGSSCRDQIEHTTGRHVLHPIEVVAGALKVNNVDGIPKF
jgi:FAD/FMN-containing dehydrogenase/Fe-S oxidoreductase